MANIPGTKRTKLFDFGHAPSGVDLMKSKETLVDIKKPLLATSRFNQPNKENIKDPKQQDKTGDILATALGIGQLAGGILTDVNNKSPQPIDTTAGALMNTNALEVKNASNSAASKLMDVVAARSDRDFASNAAEARRISGGNGTAALLGMVASGEQGKMAVGDAAAKAAQIMMEGNISAANMQAEGLKMNLDTMKFNKEVELQDYLAKKEASSSLIGAGMRDILDTLSYKSFKDEEAGVKAKNILPISAYVKRPVKK
jgi:hypothetical protein